MKVNIFHSREILEEKQKVTLGRALENTVCVSVLFRFLTPRTHLKFVASLEFRSLYGKNQCFTSIVVLEIQDKTHT